MRELDLAYKEHLYNQNEKRIAEQEKQYAYYSNNQDKLKSYLLKTLEITYATEDVEEMQLQYVNLTKKTIDQMAVVYSNPAYRYFVGDEAKAEKLTDLYETILPENINFIDKRNHRLAKLSNCSLTYVKIDKKKKRISYVVNPIWLYTIETDDDGNFLRITYPKYIKNAKGEDEFYTAVWEEDKHYLFDQYGNKIPVRDNPKMVNPYGMLPFVFTKMDESDGIYGEGQNDLINVNEQINFLLTKVVNSDILLGTEGTTLATNLGLSGKGQEEANVRKIRTGKKHPIVVENVRADMAMPSLQHITTTPYIVEIREFIDWYIKYIASMKGLNPSAVLSQLKDTSDYQKMMDAVDQMEMRKDDLEVLRVYERERYEVTKQIWNTHAEELGVDKINDDGLEFRVDFAEVEIHKTPADEQAEFEFGLKHNLITAAEFLMNKNSDLTLEEAQKIIEENRKINSVITRPQTRLESLINPPLGAQT